MLPFKEDNSVEAELDAPYPDIPAEMPGVNLESNVPNVTKTLPPAISEEDQAHARCTAVQDNDNLGPRELYHFRKARIAGVNNNHNDSNVTQPAPVYNINVKLVPAENNEIVQADRDKDDDMPALEEPVDSDDESLVNGDDSDFEKGDEYESDDTLDDDFLDEDEALEDEQTVTRSGRLSQRNQNYAHRYSHFTVGSLHEEAKVCVPTPKSTKKPEAVLGIDELRNNWLILA